jgi:hypothetical protein
MKTKKVALWSGVMALLCMGSAHAELLTNVTKSWPDVTLSNGSLYYDHNGSSTGEGLLRLVVQQGTLGLSSAGPSQTQLYSTPDLALSIEVDNLTGAFLGGTVDISFGSTAQKFSWTGVITHFGFAADGKTFNATWQLTDDQYQNLPASFSSVSNGEWAGYRGGIIISNSAGWSASSFYHSVTGAENFGLDWVLGSVNNNLAAYRAGMTSPIVVATATTADAFVPLPAGVWLFLSAFGALAPFARRQKTK